MKPWTAQLIRCELVTRWMIRLLVGGVLSLSLFGAGLLQWQLWKGQRAWAEERARIQQEGESLDPRDYYPESWARGAQFLENPLVLEFLEEWGSGEKVRPDLSKLNPDWPWGRRGFPQRFSEGEGCWWRAEAASLSTFARVYKEYSQHLGLEALQLEELSDPEVLMRILKEGEPVAEALDQYLFRVESQSPELLQVRQAWGANDYPRLLHERVEAWRYFEFMRSLVCMETERTDFALARCHRSLRLALAMWNRQSRFFFYNELQWIWEMWIRGDGSIPEWEALEAVWAGFPSMEQQISELPDLLKRERALEIHRWTHPYGSWEFEYDKWFFSLFEKGVLVAQCLWIRQRLDDFESWAQAGVLPDEVDDPDLEVIYQRAGLPAMEASILRPVGPLNWQRHILEYQAARALVRSAIRCLIYKKRMGYWPESLKDVWADHERGEYQDPYTGEVVSYQPPEAGDPLPVLSVTIRDRETRYWKGPSPRASRDVQR